MGWNKGYKILENTVVAVYNAGVLTAELLDKIAEPFKETDCDCGGGQGLKSKDGLNMAQIICKTMYPKEYEKIMNEGKNRMPDLSPEEIWDESEEAENLFDKVWYKDWKMW